MKAEGYAYFLTKRDVPPKYRRVKGMLVPFTAKDWDTIRELAEEGKAIALITAMYSETGTKYVPENPPYRLIVIRYADTMPWMLKHKTPGNTEIAPGIIKLRTQRKNEIALLIERKATIDKTIARLIYKRKRIADIIDVYVDIPIQKNQEILKNWKNPLSRK